MISNEHITKPAAGYDPFPIAKKLRSEHKDIQFNSHFFDTVKPRETGLKKLVSIVKKRMVWVTLIVVIAWSALMYVNNHVYTLE
jgi:hypothetical protein